MADDKSDDEFESNNEGQLLAEDVLHVVEDGDEYENTDTQGGGDDDDDDDDDDIPNESMEVDETPVERDDSVCTFAAHTGSVFSASLHPSKHLAVTGAEDDKAYVWDTEDGHIVFECVGHKDSVSCTGFSSDGKYVATADMSGYIKVWVVENGQCVWNFHSEDIEWLLWHSSAPILLVGTSVGEAWMWKVPSGDCKVMHGYNVPSTTATLCPDGKSLLCGYGDGGVKLWDLKESKPIMQWEGGALHKEQVNCVSVHSDNVLGLSGSSDGSVKLFSCTSGKVLSSWDFQSDDDSVNSVESLQFCDSLPLAAVGSLNGNITIYDVSTKKERCHCNAGAGIVKLLWSRHNPVIYAALLDGSVQLWDSRTAQCLKEWRGHHDALLDLSLNEARGCLLTSSDDHCSKLFCIQQQLQ